MKQGTIVDATIIEAPPSTKNPEKSRDPEMHPIKKSSAWLFGMKAHIGADAPSGLVHSVVATAANESDISQAHALLHDHETDTFGDAGYTGVEKRDEMLGLRVHWHVAAKRGKIAMMRDDVIQDLPIAVERSKAQIRTRAEHPFHVIKKSVGSSQSSLQRLGQEHGAIVQLVWPGQSGARQAAVADQPWKHCVLSAQSASGKTRKREKSVLHWHVLPAMHKPDSGWLSIPFSNTIDQRFPKRDAQNENIIRKHQKQEYSPCEHSINTP